MTTTTAVHVDVRGVVKHVGTLWTRQRNGRESASFEYTDAWLEDPGGFALDPQLVLTRGVHHTSSDRSLFGAMGDSAPDRWGRILMKRLEARLAQEEGRSPRTLRDIDHLLMVDDQLRQGALRFTSQEGGPFLASIDVHGIPPLVELPRLLAASDHVLRDVDTMEDLRLLLAPGSSLGGARPKAAVRGRSGELFIAKFPRHDDDYRLELWSHLCMVLATGCGIDTAGSSLVTAAGRRVHLVRRFDRHAVGRIPYLSAMSLIGAVDGEARSYLEIADGLRRHGAHVAEDLKQLWMRMLFSVLISNADDHLRNHGFLYDDDRRGWRLSPAFDLNPVPHAPRYLSLTIDEHNAAMSTDLVCSVGRYFGMTTAVMRDEVERVLRVIATWRAEARRLRIPRQEIDFMSGAFEHDALLEAQRLVR